MAHQHSIYDSDLHFVIDPVTREIANESGKVVIIQHDHNSERFTFEIPKEVDGHDMSLCNVCQIHYLNIEANTKVQYEGLYEIDDLQISPNGDDTVILSWLLSGNATQYVGNLSFTIRFACVADDGTVDYVWNTGIHSGISIGDVIYNSDVIAAEYADVLEAWRRELILANIVESYTPEEACEILGTATTAYVDSKHMTLENTITTDWSGEEAPYTQSLAIAELLATDNPHIAPVLSNDTETAIAQLEAWGMIGKAIAETGSLVFYCLEDKPSVAIPILIEVNR